MANRIKLSIRAVLLFGFGGLLVTTVGITLTLGFVTATKNTLSLLAETASYMVDATTQAITDDLQKYEDQARWVSEAFLAHRVSVNDLIALEDFLVGTIAATEDIAGLGFIDQSDNIYQMSRNFPKLVHGKLDEGNYPFRNVQNQILTERGSFWDTPFWHYESQQTIANLRTVIKVPTGGKILFGQGVSIKSLSKRLLETKTWSKGTPFVLYDGKYVLAHPNLTVGVFKA
ncbi:MAG: hypothetical protein R3261_08815, partial [Alphaproteobacteria bacterium]|nr:hypothetical protein [Alphaproteobacteria bacterium]